ncbi:MAG: hypothetical protein FWF28_07510 [Micrococcales bacterium]|nr:hypothetical protein [Micrococcales bacterium]
MSETTGQTPVPDVVLSPIMPDDPPKVGDFWLDARVTATASGTAYVAHDDEQTPVVLIMLSEGAAADLAARSRRAGVVNHMDMGTVVARGGEGQDHGPLGNRFRAEDDDPTEPGATPQAPWVALAYDGSPAAAAEAMRVLSAVQLANLPSVGQPAGPDFRLHWIDRFKPGVTRLWPLPWPGRHDRAGALSIFASWLLMLLLAALAILIAILIFQGASSEGPPPPVPPTSSPTGSPSPQSASPSPQSASPSPQSASPSPQSASPSPQSASPSPQSASPSPGSASPSGYGSPTPDSRL